MARSRTRPNIEFDNSVAVAADFFVLDAVAEAVPVALAIGLIDSAPVPVTVCARKVLAAPAVEFPAWRNMWGASVGLVEAVIELVV